jgi:hypothetical protein
MRAAKLLAVLAIAALGIGSFSAVAVAGKKKTTGKTTVAFCGDKKADKGRVCGSPACGTQTCWPSLDPNPYFDKSGLVSAEGEVYSKCGHRSMRLQLLDKNGVVLTTLDTGKSDLGWSLSGQLPTKLPAGTNYVRVKAEKRTVEVVSFGPPKHKNHLALRDRDKQITRVDCLAGVSRKVAIPAV